MARHLAALCCALLSIPGALPAAPQDAAQQDAARQVPAQDDLPQAKPAVLTVRVVDCRNKKGHLRLGVFDRSAGFPGERGSATLWKSIPANSEDRSFAVELPPGRYAVVVLHDENGNKKLDRNFIGIPTEGYGVTNNPKPRTRAATYGEAAFDLSADGAEKKVSIQYF